MPSIPEHPLGQGPALPALPAERLAGHQAFERCDVRALHGLGACVRVVA
jgi:hypothetical protein